MSNATQQGAIDNHHASLMQRGCRQLTVMALETDRELLRTLAQHLAEGGPEADQVRVAVKALVAVAPSKPGRILADLRFRVSHERLEDDFRDTRSMLDHFPAHCK